MKSNKRHVCTKSDPWDKTKSERATHPDAVELETDWYSDYEKYKCPHCGLRFKVELPQ